VSAAAPPLRLGLLGSPNSGKTTLFNALTGLRAKVGNYPGVTVERREGVCRMGDRDVVVVDLPGTYSLDPLSPDEAVVTRVLTGELAPPPEALVLVADACSLERSLLFVAQALQQDLPACLVVTMTEARCASCSKTRAHGHVRRSLRPTRPRSAPPGPRRCSRAPAGAARSRAPRHAPSIASCCIPYGAPCCSPR
jgi:hypothetical protein